MKESRRTSGFDEPKQYDSKLILLLAVQLEARKLKSVRDGGDGVELHNVHGRDASVQLKNAASKKMVGRIPFTACAELRTTVLAEGSAGCSSYNVPGTWYIILGCRHWLRSGLMG